MSENKVNENKMEKVNGGFAFDQQNDAMAQKEDALGQQLIEESEIKDKFLNDALTQKNNIVIQKTDVLARKEEFLKDKNKKYKKPVIEK